MSILAHAHPDFTNLDAEIAALGADLAALQDMARAFPVGVTIPLDQHAEFCQMAELVDYRFERTATMLESVGIEPDLVLS